MSKKDGYPLRGEIWWVSFDRSMGTEIQKTRPAIVVSNDDANELSEQIQVVPLTGTIMPVYPSQTIVSVLGKKSKAVAEQITTVSKLRLDKRIGSISASELTDVEYILKLQLGLLK
ncbi:MAG: type II toxin-antitoxin system PemK/MazF family toxin [Minisyncoccia bacterium]|jgi:mRNA interferase MazF